MEQTPVMNQQEYIAILFADCGYETAAQRKAWMNLRFNRDFPDELTWRQRSEAITALKQEKENRS
jgi:hypothetical protein